MLKICTFEKKFEDQIIDLIVKIQREEFGIPISPEQQPDLRTIPSYYQKNKGNFWVALAAEKVIGTIALLDISAGNAALRKMFVVSEYRGGQFGTANLLLETLLMSASHSGLNTVYLGTTSKFLAAHRFYEKNGFTLIQKAELPDTFPVMAVDSRFYKIAVAQQESHV